MKMYPQPEKKKSKDFEINSVLTVVSLILILLYADIWNAIHGTASFVVFLVLSEVLLRLVVSRAMSSHSAARIAADFKLPVYGLFAASALCMAWLREEQIRYGAIAVFLSGHYLVKALERNGITSKIKSSLIKESDGLDFGTSMAYGYYLRYLKMTLPERGDQNSGILEMIQTFEANHDVTVPVKKLFVVVQASMACPTSLEEYNSDTNIRLENAVSLDMDSHNNSGVIKRGYKHSIYKIVQSDGSLPVYIVAEGATPLSRYYEVASRPGPHSDEYKMYKRDSALNFYFALKEIIAADPECRDLCEIVFFENDGRSDVNIAKLLLQQINASCPSHQLQLSQSASVSS